MAEQKAHSVDLNSTRSTSYNWNMTMTRSFTIVYLAYYCIINYPDRRGCCQRRAIPSILHHKTIYNATNVICIQSKCLGQVFERCCLKYISPSEGAIRHCRHVHGFQTTMCARCCWPWIASSPLSELVLVSKWKPSPHQC